MDRTVWMQFKSKIPTVMNLAMRDFFWNIDANDVHFKIDTSASTAPRGFPEFDKLQLDATRREHMANLRVRLINYNEEYLAKHPQVEALLRLITIEVLCHKPYDVRGFIRNLLMQDNLETRVAKIILSKRINLERNHTVEYFQHVAEWETKCNEKYNHDLPPPEWPEPRPYRKQTRRDKKEYCHLHYYTEPFVLYPTELVKCKDEDPKKKPQLHKLPKWKKTFLLKEFLGKWGDPLKEDVESPVNSEADLGGSPEDRKKEGFSRRWSNAKKDSDLGSDSGMSECNRKLQMKCPTCRRAVLGLHNAVDKIDMVKSSMELEKRPKTISRAAKKSTTKPTPSICGKVDELDREWKNAKKVQVYTRSEKQEKKYYNDKLERLAEVNLKLKESNYWQGEQLEQFIKSWSFKYAEGEEVNFVVPLKELEKMPIDEEVFPEGRASQYSATSIQSLFKTELKGRPLTPKLMHKLAKKGKPIKIWTVPKKYKNPLYQIVINPTNEEDDRPLGDESMAAWSNIKLRGSLKSSSDLLLEESFDCCSNIRIYGSLLDLNDNIDRPIGSFERIPIVNLDGEVIKTIQISFLGNEIMDKNQSGCLNEERIPIINKEGEIIRTISATVLRDEGLDSEQMTDRIPILNLDGEVIKTVAISELNNEINDKHQIEDFPVKRRLVPIMNLKGEIVKTASLEVVGETIVDKHKSEISDRKSKKQLIEEHVKRKIESIAENTAKQILETEYPRERKTVKIKLDFDEKMKPKSSKKMTNKNVSILRSTSEKDTEQKKEFSFKGDKKIKKRDSYFDDGFPDEECEDEEREQSVIIDTGRISYREALDQNLQLTSSSSKSSGDWEE